MLIEVVIAVGIIALVLVGVSDLMTRSLRVVTYQKQRDEANAYLQKIQNDLKAQRDADPEKFYQTVSGSSALCEAGKAYTCKILVERALDNISITITATAEWSDGGNTLRISTVQSLLRATK